MNQAPQTLISRLNPAVPRHYLFVLAGGLWTIAGTILCLRAEVWLEVFPLGTEIELEALGAILAVLGYLYLFIHVVRKNIDRITGLPERVCLFAFTAWRGYLLIALMIGLGLALQEYIDPEILPFGSLHRYGNNFARRERKVLSTISCCTGGPWLSGRAVLPIFAISHI